MPMTNSSLPSLLRHRHRRRASDYSALMESADRTTFDGDLVCFSHLRWKFVFQRPQHLLSRCARERRVYFVEEPQPSNDHEVYLDLERPSAHLTIVTPRLPAGLSEGVQSGFIRALLTDLFDAEKVADFIAWYYTPMALSYSRHFSPRLTVYDCMDELSAFRGAPPAMLDYEAELLNRADLVFTGGLSLYEAKRHRHPNIHPFPSSIDAAHFARARFPNTDPPDQAHIPFPRLGFAGVIDERIDIELLRGIAQARPDWQWVFIGPVVKIDEASLPRAANIHYLGQKPYDDLPRYMAGWQLAFLPFARNAATRYISPTKTPEYLAAGKPVISTSIRDVVRPYGELGLVRIADDAETFVRHAEEAMQGGAAEWRRKGEADAFIATLSWDKTWRSMCARMSEAIAKRETGRRSPGVSRPGPERRRIAWSHHGFPVRYFDRRSRRVIE